jgi:hypothetical protein
MVIPFRNKLLLLLIGMALLILLANCSYISSPEPKEHSATASVITQGTQTKTIRSTVTRTPTVTATTTKTEAPLPIYSKGPAMSYETAIMVNEEDEQAIIDDAVKINHQLIEDVPDYYGVNRIQRARTPDEDGVFIQCKYGKDCVILATLREKSPYGRPDLIKFIWKFRERDGSYVYMKGLVAAINPNQDPKIIIPYINNTLYSFQDAQDKFIDINVITKLGVKESDNTPDVWAVTIGAPADNQKILLKLIESVVSDNIPLELSKITVCIGISIY